MDFGALRITLYLSMKTYKRPNQPSTMFYLQLKLIRPNKTPVNVGRILQYFNILNKLVYMQVTGHISMGR